MGKKENKKDEKEKDVILINKMYTGSYLNGNKGNNIGHEIINFFKASDGNNYIYITPYGKFDLTYKNRIKYVLLTDATIGGKYNIIAKVEVDNEGCLIYENYRNKESKQFENFILKDRFKDVHKEQAKDKKYGGKLLYDVYKNNIGNDEAIYATFKVKNVIMPTKTITVKINKQKGNECAKIQLDGVTLENGEFKKEKNDDKIPLNIGESNIIYLQEGNLYNFLLAVINNPTY